MQSLWYSRRRLKIDIFENMIVTRALVKQTHLSIVKYDLNTPKYIDLKKKTNKNYLLCHFIHVRANGTRNTPAAAAGDRCYIL